VRLRRQLPLIRNSKTPRPRAGSFAVSGLAPYQKAWRIGSDECLPTHSAPGGEIRPRSWVIGQQLYDGANTDLVDTTRNFYDRLRAFHTATVQ
jgi:hypothetical protein